MKYWDESVKSRKRRYLKVRRWDTYSKIIKCVLQIDPNKILEIGIGNRLVLDIIKKIGYDIKGLDIDKSLNPDYLMDVRNDDILTFKDQFDLVISSQMLEHIEYEEYLKVIKNLSEITKYAIITLPYCDKHYNFFSFNINLHLFNKVVMSKSYGKKIYIKKMLSNYHKYHRWEIGTKGLSLKKIKKDIKLCNWVINSSFFDYDYPYHYFFILISKRFLKKK